MGSPSDTPERQDSPRTRGLDPALLFRERAWLVRLAEGLLRDPAAAEDVVQEASVAALHARPRRLESTRAWLAAIVRRRAVSWQRSEARRARREQGVAERTSSGAPAADELAERAELQRLLAEAVLALQEPYRDVALRRFFGGESAEQIARETGASAATVRSRLARTLALLRARLGEHGDRHGRDWRPALVALVRLGDAAPAVGPETSSSPGPTAGQVLGSGVAAMNVVKLTVSLVAVAGAALVVVPLLRQDGPARPGALERPAVAAPLAPPEVLETPRLDGPPLDSPVRTAAVSEEGRGPLPSEASPPEAEAAELAAVLSARVIDVHGRALGSARVEHAGGTARSHADGAGRFEMELAGPWLEHRPDAVQRFVVSHPGHAALLLRARIVRGERTHVGDVVLGDAGTVAGRVQHRGEPIAGATVLVAGLEQDVRDPEVQRRAGPSKDEATPTASTDVDGRFEVLDVEVGERRVWVQAPGFGWASSPPIEVEAGTRREGITLELDRLRSDDEIRGIVLEADGTPRAGIRVDAWGMGPQRSSFVSDSTDDAGRFRLLLEVRVPHGLTFDPADATRASFAIEDVVPGTTDLVVRLPEARPLRVHVSDPDGRPVTGAIVEARKEFTGMLGTLSRGREVSDGLTELLLPSQVFDLEVTARGYEPYEQEGVDPLALGSDLEVRLSSLPGIRGRVLLPGGAPASGARVELRRQVPPGMNVSVDGYESLLIPREGDETIADEDGRFRVYPEHSGAHSIEAESEGFAITQGAAFQADPERSDEVELVLVVGGDLAGTVLVPPGESALGRLVVLHRGDGRPRTARTDGEGRYRFERLQPGSWHVETRREELPGTVSYSSGLEPPPFVGNVVVEDGATTVHDLDLRAARPCRLRGRIVSSTPLGPGFSASLQDLRTGFVDPEATSSTRVDEDGSFLLEVDEPGAYVLVVQGPETGQGRLSCTEPVSLGPDECEWRWRLEASALVLRNVPASEGVDRFVRLLFGEPVAHAEPGWREVVLRVIGDGDVTLPLLPSGPCSVQRFAPTAEPGAYPKYETLAELELVPGRTHELTLP